MDVKHTTAALQQALGQAHVDPDAGRQGDFEHWQRIFDATDRHAAPATGTKAFGGEAIAHEQTGSSSQHPWERAPLQAQARSAAASIPQQANLGAAPTTGPTTLNALSRHLPLAASHPSVSPRTPATVAEHSHASPVVSMASQPRPRAEPTAPDGRPLAQLQAHLSRNADGRLNVALRSSQPLSDAQALHAVAQALCEQSDDTSVDQVILNGKPIYRSATPSTHRFEIDC